MPAVLTDTGICSTIVPMHWKEILQGLDEFIQLELAVCRGKPTRPTDEDRQRLMQLHDTLVDASAPLLEPAVLDDQSAEYDVAVFARSVLVLMRLNECVAADSTEVLDTAGSRTLTDFPSDFVATCDDCDRLRKALRSFPELSEEKLKLLRHEVDVDAHDADRKQRVVEAIRDEFGLWPNAPGLRENMYRFFCACYPDTGIRADEVELIVTGCMIFFCLPFYGTELQTDRFQAASEKEQSPVRRFLKRAASFSQWQFAHFPVFGFLRGEDLSDDLLDRLSSRSGLPKDTLCRELSRLTAIIPLQEIDKYVVHDVWGHGWQASILRLDGLYEQLARFARPLTLNETARGAAGEKMRLADCFSGRGDQLRLDEPLFRQFVTWKITGRLPVAMTPVLAEVIADIAEFKFIDLRPDKADALLSSSLMRLFPSKLDLIMIDVPFYFSQATKVFRLMASRPKRQQRLIDELVQDGATAQSARRAVEQAVGIWNEMAEGIFAPRMKWHVEQGQLHVNVMSRLALNFLGIHRSKLRAYQWIREADTQSLPLKSFRDLMLICAAVYFESDPPKNLWRVDEFVTLRIAPLCQRLAEFS
jgi:hypothetical protein